MMKILDIRGNLVKIESSKPVQVSSLLKITDGIKEYLAQVLYAEQSGIANVVFAKILAIFGENTSEVVEVESVSLDSTCEKITIADVKTNFGDTQDIVLGELAYDNFIPTASMEFFDRKLLIVSENNKFTDLLISNFAHQLKNNGHKTIIFDTEGSCSGIKLTAGLDFKLPLNAHSIGFIYNNYFSDITDASRALIADIFAELKEYAKSVPYIPFNVFKNVIDNVLDYSQNLSLYFFKTKLERLYQSGLFANTAEEVMDWNALSEVGAATIIVDLSKVSKMFVKEYVSIITHDFENTDENIYAFLKLDDSFADKEFLKELIENEKVFTSCIIPSNFKFLPALKQNFGSYVVMGGVKKPDNFDYCKFLLKNLPNDKYVITGDFTAPLSLIFQLKEVNDVIPKQEPVAVPQAPVESKIPSEAVVDNSEEVVEKSVEEQVVDEPVYEEVADIEDEEISPVIETPIEDYNPVESVSLEPAVEEAVEEQVDDMVVEIAKEEINAAENVPTVSNEETLEEYSSENNEDELEDIVNTDSEIEILDDSSSQELENIVEEQLDQQTDSVEELSDYDEVPETLNDSEEMIIEDYISPAETLDDDLQIEAELLETLPEEEDLVLGEESSEDFFIEPEKTEEELLDEQIRRDVDRVYMAQPKEDIDELSEDDLDFIEELVEGDDIIVEDLSAPEQGSLEQVDELELGVEPEEDFLESASDEVIEQVPQQTISKKNTATPAVPIYAAEIPQEAIVQSDPIQQGDRVVHVKFGIGVVEKIFSYGTKNFCSINFENIGRKVLDPNVTELKKA